MTSQDILSRLQRLPTDLEATYREILDGISNHEALKNAVDRAFMWVLGSRVPPENEELLSVINLGRENDVTSQQQKITKDDLLLYCHNLLIFDKSTRSWRFSHASVVEYIAAYSWTSQDPHSYAAKLCLEFLSNTNYSYPTDDTGGEPEEIFLEINDTDVAFHSYCRDNWIYHVQKQEQNVSGPHEFDPELITLLRAFLGSPTEGALAYREWHQDLRQRRKIIDWTIAPNELYPPSIPILAMSRLPLDTILSDWWDSYVFSSTHMNLAHENPLILSARAGCTPICERLIGKGAPIDDCGDRGSALAAAAYEGHLEMAQLLLEKDASPDLLLSTGEYGSALAAAASKGSLEMVQLLLEKGATANILLSSGIFGSALAAAAYKGNLEVAQLLLDKGATTDLLLSTGIFGSPLVAAAYQANLNMVQFLTNNGADPDQRLSTGIYGYPLMAAATAGHTKVLKYLIHEAKADINSPLGHSRRYGSPLEAAAHMGNIKSVEILLRAGVDPNLVLNNGSFCTALHASKAEINLREQNSVEFYKFFPRRLGEKTPVAEAKLIIAVVLENPARVDELEGYAPGLLEDNRDEDKEEPWDNYEESGDDDEESEDDDEESEDDDEESEDDDEEYEDDDEESGDSSEASGDENKDPIAFMNE